METFVLEFIRDVRLLFRKLWDAIGCHLTSQYDQEVMVYAAIIYSEVKPGDEVKNEDLSRRLEAIINLLSSWGFKHHIFENSRKHPKLVKFYNFILTNYGYFCYEMANAPNQLVSFEDIRISWLIRLSEEVKASIPSDKMSDVEFTVRKIKLYNEIFQMSDIRWRIKF